jgi:hypothetical protein
MHKYVRITNLAESVKQCLISKDIPETRLLSLGFGEGKSIASKRLLQVVPKTEELNSKHLTKVFKLF